MSGTGTTQANGGLTLNGAAKTLTSGRTLSNAGAATWSAGNFNSGLGAIFSNTATGTWDVQFDGTISHNQGGAVPQFNNAGTFTKSAGAGTATIGIAFNNSNTVQANSGTLALTNGGTSTGSFTAADLATLNFGGGTHNLNAGSSVSGAGTIGFSGGTTNLAGLANTYNVTGRTLINGGTANFNSAATTGTLELSSGILAGSGTLTVSGLTTWSGGEMSGTGTTQANGGLTLNGAAKTLTSGRTLSNAGAPPGRAGNFNSGLGAIFSNTATGTWDVQFDGTISHNQGGAVPQFNNAGTFTKSAGAGTSYHRYRLQQQQHRPGQQRHAGADQWRHEHGEFHGGGPGDAQFRRRDAQSECRFQRQRRGNDWL